MYLLWDKFFYIQNYYILLIENINLFNNVLSTNDRMEARHPLLKYQT